MRSDFPDRVGTTIGGRYALGRIIGEGGAATVYEARDLRLGHGVAVKVLHLAESTAVRRMAREARVAAALRHPNVCLVTDIGETDDQTPFIVMERLVGSSLAEHLHGGRRLEVAQALDIAKQVLSVLHVAHAHGVVHRDIKPENLFLADVPGRPPLVKVLDFGVASDESDLALTSQGGVPGTPAYMSPEQAASYRDVDGRSDIYSCATVLFECLTGRLPFEAPTRREMMTRIMRGGAPSVAALRPEIPGLVARAVDRALRVEREARFATALEFLQVLDGQAELPHDGSDLETLKVRRPGASRGLPRDDETVPMPRAPVRPRR